MTTKFWAGVYRNILILLIRIVRLAGEREKKPFHPKQLDENGFINKKCMVYMVGSVPFEELIKMHLNEYLKICQSQCYFSLSPIYCSQIMVTLDCNPDGQVHCVFVFFSIIINSKCVQCSQFTKQAGVFFVT